MEGHRVFETQDGSKSLFSERFGVSYHSKYGAWQETQHLFIDAGLRYAAVDKAHINVLDIGYGTGLNAIATLLFARNRQLEVEYTGVEKYPVPSTTLLDLNYAAELEWTKDEQALYHALQKISWPGKERLTPKLTVEKLKTSFETLSFDQAFDIIYYDAFAPEAQPELWTPLMFEKMFNALRPGGSMVTYCAKGQVKRDMKSVGFLVERLKGPPGKREMTRATRQE